MIQYKTIEPGELVPIKGAVIRCLVCEKVEFIPLEVKGGWHTHAEMLHHWEQNPLTKKWFCPDHDFALFGNSKELPELVYAIQAGARINTFTPSGETGMPIVTRYKINDAGKMEEYHGI